MTAEEEAIKTIRAAQAEVEWEYPMDYAVAFDMAIEAIEKRIPKRPKEIPIKENKNLWHLYCPSCKNWIGMWNSRLNRVDMHNISNGNICPYCGQAIDEWMSTHCQKCAENDDRGTGYVNCSDDR